MKFSYQIIQKMKLCYMCYCINSIRSCNRSNDGYNISDKQNSILRYLQQLQCDMKITDFYWSSQVLLIPL